jgi:hypothetical protein
VEVDRPATRAETRGEDRAAGTTARRRRERADEADRGGEHPDEVLEIAHGPDVRHVRPVVERGPDDDNVGRDRFVGRDERPPKRVRTEPPEVERSLATPVVADERRILRPTPLLGQIRRLERLDRCVDGDRPLTSVMDVVDTGRCSVYLLYERSRIERAENFASRRRRALARIVAPSMSSWTFVI